MSGLETVIRARPNRPVLDALRSDPTQLMVRANLPPDPWQARLLTTDAQRILLLCSRQAGKSLTAAAIALKTALLEPRSLILLLSPSMRQSGELFRDKFLPLYHALGRPLPAVRETALELQLSNGSRVISLPGTEGTVRCFSGVRLLVIDEAARVSDALYCAVRPMLAVSQGRLIALSTPFGKRGWFCEEWFGPATWERVQIKADQCPRITPEFLAEEKRALGERYYRQEYMTSFEDVIDAVFAYEDIQAALSDEVQPLFLAGVS